MDAALGIVPLRLSQKLLTNIYFIKNAHNVNNPAHKAVCGNKNKGIPITKMQKLLLRQFFLGNEEH